MVWWVVVLGILEEVELGCCGGFQVSLGGSGSGMAVEWRGVYCWKLVEIGEGKWRGFGGREGAWFQGNQGGRRCWFFLQRKRSGMLVALALWMLSLVRQKVVEEGRRFWF